MAYFSFIDSLNTNFLLRQLVQRMKFESGSFAHQTRPIQGLLQEMDTVCNCGERKTRRSVPSTRVREAREVEVPKTLGSKALVVYKDTSKEEVEAFN